ncbi:hypothetical protein Phou_019740 [Phytohabitans houttuyneae]|uniref:Uncharacterized protein n=1 Tax=Phytohabitans houttuyneae TaxID=1076126 RepID=A0A6V8K267_9ACTN|nr:hypothetical protein Phou_019740 [Phytohabitans houttuyneae]
MGAQPYNYLPGSGHNPGPVGGRTGRLSTAEGKAAGVTVRTTADIAVARHLVGG